MVVGTQGGHLLTGPSGDLTVSLSHPPTLGTGMDTRILETTAPRYPTAPSRTQTAMDRVMTATRMMTTMESQTVGTTAAWCPTPARKTRTVRRGRACSGDGACDDTGAGFRVGVTGARGRGRGVVWACP